LLPLFTLGLIKNPILQEEIGADERTFLLSYIKSMPTYVSVPFMCPRLYDFLKIPEDCCLINEDGRVFLPKTQALSIESIKPDGLYLLDDGRFFYLWVGEELANDKCREVFGIERDLTQSQKYDYTIRNSDQPNALCSRIHTLIDRLRREKPNFQNLQVIARRNGQDDIESLDEKHFFDHLIEDAKNSKKGKRSISKMSYIDFLCDIHKKIQYNAGW